MFLNSGTAILNLCLMEGKVEALKPRSRQDSVDLPMLIVNGIQLADAEGQLREIGDLKVRHTGKKSAIAEAKEADRKVAPEERGSVRAICAIGRERDV